MPHVADDGSPLHERLIYGKSGVIYLPVLVDTDGNLAVALKTDQNIQARNYGYYGADWRKVPVPFGATLSYAEYKEDLAVTATQDILDFTAVAASTVMVITNLMMRYTGTVPTEIFWVAVISGMGHRLWGVRSPVSATCYDRQGWWVLGPTEYLRLYVDGSTLNDDLYGELTGFVYSVA